MPRFYRLRDIIGDKKHNIPPIIPVSKSTFWEWCRTGKAPKPVKLSERVTCWRAEDIEAFAARLAA